MEKITTHEIKACKWKDKEDRQVKRISKLGFAIEWTTWKTIEKHAKAKFITTWILVVLAKVGGRFHHDFQVGFRTNLCKYMGVN